MSDDLEQLLRASIALVEMRKRLAEEEFAHIYSEPSPENDEYYFPERHEEAR